MREVHEEIAYIYNYVDRALHSPLAFVFVFNAVHIHAVCERVLHLVICGFSNFVFRSVSLCVVVVVVVVVDVVVVVVVNFTL